MSLSRLFWWIYQLSPNGILCLLMVGTLVFLLLHRRLTSRNGRRGFPAVLLTVWVAAALWATIFSRSSGTVRAFQMLPFHSYREVLATGNREILRSNFMNLVLFYPAGLLLAALLPKRLRGWRLPALIGTFAAFSFGIEYAQYSWALGRPEIDDVIHNTLGAVLGAFPAIFWIP